MSEVPLMMRIIRRDFATLEVIAEAEQRRQTDRLLAAARAEKDSAERRRRERRVHDVDGIWAAIRCWLRSPALWPLQDPRAAVAHAGRTAALALDAWKAEGDRANVPDALHWLGLITLARALREAFPEAERAA